MERKLPASVLCMGLGPTECLAGNGEWILDIIAEDIEVDCHTQPLRRCLLTTSKQQMKALEQTTEHAARMIRGLLRYTKGLRRQTGVLLMYWASSAKQTYLEDIAVDNQLHSCDSGRLTEPQTPNQ